MDVDSHLSDKEVITNALLKSEDVKEEITETNTKANERTKSGSNKFCIREDLAKEKLMFSQESSQAIFEMGNVELTELKTSNYVFKGAILCACGKHIRPDQEMIRRIRAVFEILKAPYFRTSVVIARSYKHGPNLWQEHHHKSKRRTTGYEKGRMKIYVDLERWKTDMTYGESQLAIGWSDAWGRYLDQIAQIDISHKAPQEQRTRYNNLLYVRSVDEE